MVEWAGALLLRGGQVLLGLRSPNKRTFPNCWDMPGGHVEPGETPADALMREAMEELGIRPERFSRLAVIGEGTGERLHVFAVTAWSPSEPVLANAEHTELRWFDLAEIETLSPLALECYRSLCAGLMGRS